jgi:hypothetical protein
MSQLFRVLVPCSCCSVPCFLGLRFCLSCGAFRLVPVLLFAGLVLCSCSRQVALPVAPCVVEVQELEQGQFFSLAAVVPGAQSGQAVWFQFQCQFPAWVGSAQVFYLSVVGEPEAHIELEGSVSGLLQGFWVPFQSLPAGFQRVQWRVSGQVSAR